MNKHNHILALFAGLALAGQSLAAATPAPREDQPANARLKPCTSVAVDAPIQVRLGKSTLLRLGTPANRMVIGGLSSARAGKPVDVPEDKTAPPGQKPPSTGTDGVADVDVMLLSPTELFILGKRSGSMNIVLQGADGRCAVRDVMVTVDPEALQAKLAELMPEETGIRVVGAENALVLTGRISDAIKLDEAMSLAMTYGDCKKVVNMLRISTPQQVMLEVKIAEVSKSLLDKLGSQVGINRATGGGEHQYSLLSNFFSNGGGLLEAFKIGRTAVAVDGQKDDGLVRVLAEPNIMAISGQHASFLSGGKIFIPVSQTHNNGVPTITLEEKEFGIGVKFTPTVLDGTRVNLKIVSEVSELTQTGSPFITLSGITSVLPSLTVRRADTTVQLNDGQSFVIAGLIKHNVNQTVKRYPGLGEVPILGALFRSTEFQSDQTELMFVVTPRLVKPLPEAPRLPTDNHVLPSRAELYSNGSLESATPAPSAPATVTK